LNGGKCFYSINSFGCKCLEGWNGTYCENVKCKYKKELIHFKNCKTNKKYLALFVIYLIMFQKNEILIKNYLFQINWIKLYLAMEVMLEV